jgi:hypothetical protein
MPPGERADGAPLVVIWVQVEPLYSQVSLVAALPFR